MVSSKNNFLQPVIKKEFEPADWGATCMPPSQKGQEDQREHTDGLGSTLQAQFPSINHNARYKNAIKFQMYGQLFPQCNCH